VASTLVFRILPAPPERVFQAFIDPELVPRWKVPAGMTCQVHHFDGRERGRFRISLSYVAPDRAGKTTGRTDTYHGHFAKLVPGELVVEVDEFETDDPQLQGEMTITVQLRGTADGTELTARHDELPPGVSPADNELGWNQSLDRLAAILAEHAG
jgi:uncharacterized protein YndB with AHSA1/START domain